ncbi:DUF2867 domain-containing protein [Pseudomonas sp. RC10]|uniref:DUF2867 domain-containing protein n=1 Tax=Pseudomonas bambusae TaxID=3139142 RepID=UPI003139F815
MDSRNATIHRSQPPAPVSLAQEYDSAYYSDCFVYSLGSLSGSSALTLYRQMTHLAPPWVNRLLHIRDLATGILGMTPTRGFQEVGYPTRTFIQPGEKLDFFEVVANIEQELVLRFDDPHFFVSISLYIQRELEEDRLYITSIVTPYSQRGKLYITLIAPFHRKIAKTMISTLA